MSKIDMFCFDDLICRSFVAKFESAVQNEKDEKEAELNRNLRKADLEAIVSKIEKDLEVLEKHTGESGREGEEHALDMKYLRDRQQFLVFFQL